MRDDSREELESLEREYEADGQANDKETSSRGLPIWPRFCGALSTAITSLSDHGAQLMPMSMLVCVE